ncbi:MAG: hypothetical protein IPH03_06390 [Tetrasphaera sp.]|nr:hypothetical protein [Tetrasphaera sp.]
MRRSGLPDPTEVIRLGALGPDDIKLGVRAFGFTGTEAELDSVAQMVAETSGGHPTLVSTLVRAVVQNGVDSAIGGGLATADLTWFVERILTDLEPAARAVAQYAAIDGTLDLPVLATVVGETVETTTGLLERLVRAGLVTQSASGGAGLPPAVATAVRTLAGPITVQMLHADLAAAYRASEHRPPGKVVEHLRGAGTLIPRVELGRWIGRLGSAALRARAPLTAREHFAEALELFGDDVPSESLPWRLESVRASYLAGRFDEGARVADRAAAVALTLMDREAFVDAAVLSATPAVPDGSTRRTAVALLDTAATWVEPGDGRRIEVLEALLRSMVFTTATNELAKADAAARELASLDPSTSEGEALAALGLRHHDIARPVAARQRFLLSQRAVVAARASGRPELVLTCLRALAADAVQRTDADPVRTLHTYTVTAAAIGDAYHEWLSWALRGAWHEWAGEASAAMEALAAADGLAPYVDPEAVSMAALARGLSAAWREGDLAALAVGLGRAETDGLAVPTLADAVDAPIPGAMLGIAREAVAARQGRPVDLDAVEVGLDHSPIGAVGLPASALAARAIGGTASATAARLRGRITPLLHPHLEDLVVIDGGLGILGRVTQVAALAEADGHCPVH